MLRLPFHLFVARFSTLFTTAMRVIYPLSYKKPITFRIPRRRTLIQTKCWMNFNPSRKDNTPCSINIPSLSLIIRYVAIFCILLLLRFDESKCRSLRSPRPLLRFRATTCHWNCRNDAFSYYSNICRCHFIFFSWTWHYNWSIKESKMQFASKNNRQLHGWKVVIFRTGVKTAWLLNNYRSHARESQVNYIITYRNRGRLG